MHSYIWQTEKVSGGQCSACNVSVCKQKVSEMS